MNKILLFLVSGLVLASCNSEDPEPTPEPAGPAAAGPVKIEVLEYVPAPGQFVNEMPLYSPGMGSDAMRVAAQAALERKELVSLGAFGGYIVLKLANHISNGEGPDFRITGNAYYTRKDSEGVQYGSSEPGVVYVMKDSNGNGLPDDYWYELWGDATEGTENLAVIYEQRSLGDDKFEVIVQCPDESEQIWTSNPAFHPHSYYPIWRLDESTLLFTGRMLPPNGHLFDDGFYSQKMYSGYADSQPDNSEASGLDISAARDAYGKSVYLDRIDFIKIQTGVLQFNGPIGECSTEVGPIVAL